MQKNDLETCNDISESKYAKWAYWVSFVPFYGLLPFIVLAFGALYNIGKIGQTGLWRLRSGVKVCLIINILFLVPYFFGLYINCYKHFFFLPLNGVVIIYQDGKKVKECPYRFGSKEGKYINWYLDGKTIQEEGMYKKGFKVGVWAKYDGNGGKMFENEYDNNGKLISERQYLPPDGTLIKERRLTKDGWVVRVFDFDGTLTKISIEPKYEYGVPVLP